MPEMGREGSHVIWRMLTDDEFEEELVKKLEEELDELKEEVGKNRERDLKELADVAEVYETAWDILNREEYYDLFESAMEELEKGLDMWDIDPEELLGAKIAKVARMGSFKKRKYIEKVSVDESNPWLQRYLEYPDKYPEIL